MQVNLKKITGKSSGIVLCDNSKIFVYNWKNDNGFPLIFGDDMLLNKQIGVQQIPEGKRTDNVLLMLPKRTGYNFEKFLCGVLSGTYYDFPEYRTVIIIPDNWI